MNSADRLKRSLSIAICVLVSVCARLDATGPASAPAASQASRGAAVVDGGAIDAFIQGQMAEKQYPSLSIGVVRDQKLIFARAYGLADRERNRPATVDTIYRIGSITKVFTTTAMCILRDEGRFQLDDPISRFLPRSVKLPTDGRGAPAITFRHLATHTSGLPRMPANFAPDQRGYTPQELYEGLAQTDLIHPIGAKTAYSNLGVGLLGHVLTCITGQSYDALLRSRLLDPLGMTHTAYQLSDEQKRMLATGYMGKDQSTPAPEDDYGVLAGCGDLASNIPDLARFLSLQMRRGQVDVKPVAGGTLTELHTPQRLMDGWESGVGLGWITTPPAKEVKELAEIGDIVWHNGGTLGGYYAWIGFAPGHKLGAIVLTNASQDVDGLGFALLVMAFEQLNADRAIASLPSGAEVMDAYVKATGGAEAHDGLRTLMMRGTMNAGGIKMSLEGFEATGSRFYCCTKVLGRIMSEEGCDGRIVWERSFPEGVTVEDGDSRAILMREAFLQQHSQWQTLFKEARCTRVTRFHDHDCYQVELAAREGPPETRYYDVESRLLIGSVVTMDVPALGQVPVESVHSDYRRVGGVLHPFRLEQTITDIKLIFVVEAMEANVEIAPERFALPAEVRTLLRQQATSSPTSAPSAIPGT